MVSPYDGTFPASELREGEVCFSSDANVLTEDMLRTTANSLRVEVPTTNAIKLETKNVILDPEITISTSKAVIGVLEKFAEKHKITIQLMAFSESSYHTLSHSPVNTKDKLTIYIPIKMGEFIHCYMYNLVDICKNPEQRISTILLNDTYAQAILSHGQGWIHIDPLFENKNSSTHIGHAIENEIVLLTDLSSADDFFKKSLMMSILFWYKHYEKEGKLSKQPTYLTRVMNNYMDFISNIEYNLKKILQTQISTAKNDIYTHFKAIQNLEKKVLDTSILLSSFSRRFAKNKHDTNRECVEKMLKPLLEENKYKMFEFASDGQSITAYTGLIQIEHYKRTYDIGEFKIIVNLDGTITMENITNKRVIIGDNYDHPHIHDKFPCLGNIKEQVSEMIKNFNFIPLFDLLHEYLRTYTNEDGARPFVGIKYWFSKPEEWCECCDKPKEDCECHIEKCVECDLPLSRCACNRCPKSNALMESVDCGRCDDWDEDEGQCRF